MSTPKSSFHKAAAIVVLLAFGLTWARYVLGRIPLDIHNTEWVVGDLAVVYFAWVQYLADPHSHGLLTQRMSFPLEMNVALFDPMPIFLISVGKLAPWVPNGQYLGWYFVLCVLLQAVFGYLTMGELIKHKSEELGNKTEVLKLLGGCFFVLAPYSINRFGGHTALASQWILVASIWTCLRTRDASTAQWLLWNGTLQFVASGINPYIAVMTGMTLGTMIFAPSHNGALANRLFRLLALVAVTAIGFYVFGFMGGASVRGGGYGSFSMNMLGPLDSNGDARLFPLDIPDATGMQSFEGFNYLGLGTILLLASALTIGLRGSRGPVFLPIRPIALLILCAYALALSTTITLGHSKLHLMLPDAVETLLNRFRASGRFFWVSAFWLVAVSIHVLVSRCATRWSTGLLALFLLIQLVDIAPIGREVRHALANYRHLSLTPHELARIPIQTKALIALPPWQCSIGRSPGGLRGTEFTGYAAIQLNLPTNNFYAARTLEEQRKYHCDMNAALTRVSTDYTYFLYSSIYRRNQTLFDDKFRCEHSESIYNAYICTPK
ncbi:hypothetical protein KBW71_08275 [Hydrogenophaga aromaticivorans]|uniref:DUF6311 domain-containing protein n=1 Tax=Hydrogenophaga aromaticivorans TaxID=2610898 RepID=UPI001B35D563|nr:DUF6311 domain-containing protein [Hydrogenophaga aromaticivorans]MBQ0918439.1 hypothetical protein [Hydrogenophaga aromaticivorans]